MHRLILVMSLGAAALMAGCAGGAGGAAPSREAGKVRLAVLPDSFIDGGGAAAFEIATAGTPDGLTATILARGAHGLKALTPISSTTRPRWSSTQRSRRGRRTVLTG